LRRLNVLVWSQVVAKTAPRRVTAAEMEPEKAALLGLTVDEYRAQVPHSAIHLHSTVSRSSKNFY
jgi:hypothetical protein